MSGERELGGQRSQVGAVKVRVASGAADSFDGNHTNDVWSWMFANSDWRDDKWPGLMIQLMEHTANGHLSWVVFPRQGFRVL